MSTYSLSLNAAAPGRHDLFWLGSLLYIVMFCACLFWTLRAQLAYLRLYEARRPPGGGSELPGAIYFSPRAARDLRGRQADPELEVARRRVTRRRRVTLAAMLIGSILPIGFSMVRW